MPQPASPRKPVTLRDIAEQLGVSITTVSSVLNPRSNPAKVGLATRRAVLEAARRLGYRRNAAAARMGGSQTRTLGILLVDLIHPITSPIADAFEQEAQRLGYQCFIGCTRGDALQKARNIERFLEHDVQGMLLTTIWQGPDDREALDMIFQAGVPMVYADYMWEDHPAPLVCSNHSQGGRLLARHLIETGHRRFLFLGPELSANQFSVRERIRGLYEELAAQGLPPGALDVRGPQPMMAGVNLRERYAQPVLEALNSAHPPSAVVCANDSIAWSLILGLSAAGLSVPDDVAVTGYDDLALTMLQTGLAMSEQELLSLPMLGELTSVRQPLRQIGREAARVLIGRIEGNGPPAGEPPETCLLDVGLVARNSSRLPTRCRH